MTVLCWFVIFILSEKYHRSPGDRWMIFGPVEYIPPIEVAVKARRSGELFLISVDGIFFLSWDGLRCDIGMVWDVTLGWFETWHWDGLRHGSLLVCKLDCWATQTVHLVVMVRLSVVHDTDCLLKSLSRSSSTSFTLPDYIHSVCQNVTCPCFQQLFISWLLSQDNQTTWSTVTGSNHVYWFVTIVNELYGQSGKK